MNSIDKDSHMAEYNEVESSAQNNKKPWVSPIITTFPAQKSEGKDFVNPDEGFFTSGPS